MIAAFAPATVSNVAAGFDVLGFALDEPGDVVVARLADAPGVVDRRDHGRRRAAVARPGEEHRRRCRAGPAGRCSAPGRASPSTCTRACRWPAASAAAAPAPWRRWWPSTSCSVVRRRSTSSVRPRHGGRAGRLRRRAPRQRRARRSTAASCWPAASIRQTSSGLPVPDGLACAVLHPHLEVQTGTARALLGDSVPLATAVRQWANLGALVSALYTGDLALLSRVAGRSRGRAEAGGARAGLRACQGGGAATRAPSAAACRARARRSSRWRRRSTAARVVGDGDGRGLCRRTRAWRGPVGVARRHVRRAHRRPRGRALVPFISTRGGGHAGRAGRGGAARVWRPTAASTCRTSIPAMTPAEFDGAAWPVARRRWPPR